MEQIEVHGRVVVLGCGTSTGVPVIGCNCPVCTSTDPKNKRTRTSVYIKFDNGVKVLIDVTPDFRAQAIREKLTEVSFVLITHSHADHINGLDDLRQINFLMKGYTIPVYASEQSISDIYNRFDYIFKPTQEGGGKPKISLHILEPWKTYEINGIPVTPLLVKHGVLDVFGYKFGKNFAYITDANYIPKKTLEFLFGVKVLFINALRHIPHSTHFSIKETLELVELIKPEKAFLIHLGHSVSYKHLKSILPNYIEPAYDGLKVEF